MRQLALFPLVLALASCAPVSGCSQLGPILSPNSVTQGQKLDEQLLGGAYSAAALANVSLTRAAPFMTVAQAKEAQHLKATYDQAIADAADLKAKLDVNGYNAKIAAAKSAIDGVTHLLANVRS